MTEVLGIKEVEECPLVEFGDGCWSEGTGRGDGWRCPFFTRETKSGKVECERFSAPELRDRFWEEVEKAKRGKEEARKQVEREAAERDVMKAKSMREAKRRVEEWSRKFGAEWRAKMIERVEKW